MASTFVFRSGDEAFLRHVRSRRLPVLAALGPREVYRSGDEAFLRHPRSRRLPVLAALGRREVYRSGDEAFLRHARSTVGAFQSWLH